MNVAILGHDDAHQESFFFFLNELRVSIFRCLQVFWLCARAMELLPKLYERSHEQLRKSPGVVQHMQAASSSSPSNENHPAVACQAVLALGWQASLLEDSVFIGKVREVWLKVKFN